MSNYKDIVAMWRHWNVQSKENLELRLNNFRVLFAYHSGKIENEDIDYHDTREIFERGKVISYTGDIKTLFEQQNQKHCYEYLVQAFAIARKIDIPFVLKIHEILTHGTYDDTRYSQGERPGSFKIHDYVTGKDETGAAPEDVEEELAEVLEEINDYTGDEILKAGTYFHAKFENIHPFADGNGRVGRTLFNYYLLLHNHPPIIVYEEDRKEYYAGLESFDRQQSIAELYSFFKTQTEKTWEKALIRETAKNLNDDFEIKNQVDQLSNTEIASSLLQELDSPVSLKEELSCEPIDHGVNNTEQDFAPDQVHNTDPDID